MKNDAKVFYGWWIVAGACLLNFAGIGIIINSYGIFIKPVTESLGIQQGEFYSVFFNRRYLSDIRRPGRGQVVGEI